MQRRQIGIRPGGPRDTADRRPPDPLEMLEELRALRDQVERLIDGEDLETDDDGEGRGT